MTRSSHLSTAVQDKLNAQVDIIALGVACNLDAISERRQGSMCPATSAVLRNMLVQRFRQVTLAIDITPVEGFGKLVGTDVGMWESRHEAAVNSVIADLDFAKVLRGGDGEERGKGKSSIQLHGDDIFVDILIEE